MKGRVWDLHLLWGGKKIPRSELLSEKENDESDGEVLSALVIDVIS